MTKTDINTLNNFGRTQEISQIHTSSGSGDIQSLLGVKGRINENDLPLLASKFLELINDRDKEKHKINYDVQIQKEIHEIQV